MKIINIRYLSSPIIIHAHGYSYRRDKNKEVLFDRVKKKLRAEPARNTGEIKGLTIVTWNNKEEITPLQENLKHFGLPHLVLGREYAGKEWRMKFKLETLRAALPDIATEHVLCIDSFDALILDDPKKGLERFKKAGCEMLFNASVYHWPPEFETLDFEQKTEKVTFRYLNGGCFFAKTEFVKRVLEDNLCQMRGNYSDFTEQMFYKLMYQKYYPRIKIDSRCRVFQSLKRVKARLFMGNLFVV